MDYVKLNDTIQQKLVKIYPSTNMSWGISCASSDTAAARL